MKHNWTYKKLTDVCGIQYGFPFDSHCFTDDSSFPPLIRIRDVMRGFSETFYNGDVPEDYYVKAGEYLIGMDGEFNIAPWRSEKALLNQRVCKIYSSDANTSIHFIYYSLIKLLKQIEAETPSVTVKHLSAKRLNQIELPIPSLDEQQAIVRELDGISRLIDLQEEQLREYDRLAQSLFYSTFGDPTSNPKGWEVKKLGEVAEQLFAGGDVPKNDLSQERDESHPYPIFSNGVVQDGLYGYTSCARVVEPALTITARGTIGVVFKRSEPFFPVVRLLVLVPKKEVLGMDYTMYCLRTFNIENNGVAIPQLTVPMLKQYAIPLPPLSLQQSFAAQIEAIEQQKALIRRSLDETRTLLAARMQYYFNS